MIANYCNCQCHQYTTVTSTGCNHDDELEEIKGNDRALRIAHNMLAEAFTEFKNEITERLEKLENHNPDNIMLESLNHRLQNLEENSKEPNETLKKAMKTFTNNRINNYIRKSAEVELSEEEKKDLSYWISKLHDYQ